MHVAALAGHSKLPLFFRAFFLSFIGLFLGLQSASAANLKPTISGTPATSVAVGSTYSFTPTAKDPEGKALFFVVASKPSWARFSTKSGQMSGTPSTAGTWKNIKIMVTDGVNTTVLPVFNITAATSSTTNRAPTISGTPSQTATVGQTYSFKPAASDADNNSLGFSIQNKPSWATFSTSSGTLSGTPSATGSHQNIVISVSDAKTTSSLGAFTITVSAASIANAAPKISGMAATSVNAGAAYNFKPTASDTNGDKLTFSISNRPAWAAFNTSTGQLSGTPSTSQTGAYANIVIKVSDGKASASLPAFSINVAQTQPRSATLSWTPPTQSTDGSTLTNLAGYRIHYGASASVLSQTVQVSNAGVTTYVVENLSPGTYYFSVKAYTGNGSESAGSNVVSKTVQ